MNTLPAASQCCAPSCDNVQSVQVPGPSGNDGTDGTNGTNGVNPFTTFTAIFTIPAELASAVATVGDTSWMVISQKLYGSRVDGSVHAFLEVVAIGGPTTVTLKNLEDSASSAYIENSAPASTLSIGSKLCPAGIQGPTGLLSGSAAGGDLKGTYPNPKISVANTKGSSLWGNGIDTVAVPAGTNGHMLAYDSTDAEGVKSFKPLPLTADANVADNRVPTLDRPAGTETPSPLQASKVTITDNGAIRADGSGGNSRGTDAVDLQVTRGGATQVASGTNSFIGGGLNNTASGTGATVAGGGTNIASATSATVAGGNGNTSRTQESFIGGGRNNFAGDAGLANNRAVVGGGDANSATGQESAVCGGQSNVASGTQSSIGGGDTNTASGDESHVGGGQLNTASATQAFVGAGTGNVASNTDSAVLGGTQNTASGQNSAVIGGYRAQADKYCQIAHASGQFAAKGDAQTSELMWRISTTDATANVEMFLDGAAVRATIPNNTSWVFEILHIGRSSTGVTAAWKTVGAIKNNAGTTALVAAVTNTLIADGTGGTWGVVGNAPVVDADDPNDSLRIRVTGAVATSIRWTSYARLVEVNF